MANSSCVHCSTHPVLTSPSYILHPQVALIASGYHFLPTSTTYHTTTSPQPQTWSAISPTPQVYQAPPQVPSGCLLPIPAGTQQFIKYEHIGGSLQPVTHYRFPTSSTSNGVTGQGLQQSQIQQRRGFNIYHGPDAGTPPPIYSTLPPAAFPFPAQVQSQDQTLPQAPLQAGAATEEPPRPTEPVQVPETGRDTNARDAASGMSSSGVGGASVVGLREQDVLHTGGRLIGTIRLRGGDSSGQRK